jgi:S1-C subfamily serine protease
VLSAGVIAVSGSRHNDIAVIIVLTPTATSRSSTSRICGRSRCCSPKAWRIAALTRGGGDFVATPVRIREVGELNGPDIYRTTTVTREMNTIRGAVRQGDSGWPIIDLDGKALGVAFGAAVDDPDTGFVLTAREVAPQLAKVGNTVPVARAPWEAMVGTACPLGSRVLLSS